MTTRESPRIRRLRSDFKAMKKLRAESTIIDFSTPGEMYGGPPEVYVVRFRGRGLWVPEDSKQVLMSESHEVTIKLGASYPRMMPELSWRTPIFHPNISAGGVVCLGGYGTNWVPSLQLDEMCTMLWDMIRYKNFDVDSPYNREAANWAKSDHAPVFPIDNRSIRDRVETEPKRSAPVATIATQQTDKELEKIQEASTTSSARPGELPSLNLDVEEAVSAELGRDIEDGPDQRHGSSSSSSPTESVEDSRNPSANELAAMSSNSTSQPDVLFLDDDSVEVVDADVADESDSDILFID